MNGTVVFCVLPEGLLHRHVLEATNLNRMKPALLLLKTSLKQFWDIDPYLVDSALMTARMQVIAGWQCINQTSIVMTKALRTSLQALSTEVQSLVA
jgi:hypothetical protein